MALLSVEALLTTSASGPQDIQAAGGGKAQALGVLTGVYSRQDLEGCGAGVLPVYLQRHVLKLTVYHMSP